MTKKQKIRSIIIYTVAVLLILISILTLFYFTASYPEFEKTMKTEVSIPGLDEGFVPQGMAYADSNKGYLISGYMVDKSLKSRLYFVPDDALNAPHYVTIKDASDDKLTFGHLGGVATVGDNVWLASEGVVMRVSLAQVVSVADATEVHVIDEFNAGNAASFAYASDDKLYIGEYYKDGKFETDVTHKVTTKNGYNQAIASEYTIDSTVTNGVVSTTPNLILSLPAQVQGFTYDSGKIILSTSYGIAASEFHIFNIDLDTEEGRKTDKTYSFNGVDIPMIVLDIDANLSSTLKGPAMSEGMDVVGGRVHILFESACDKYKYYNRTRTREVLSIEVV